MKNSGVSTSRALALGLLFTCGVVQAQLRVPSTSQSGGNLGGGLQAPSASPQTPSAPSAPAAAPTEEERSPDSVIQEIADCVLPSLPQDWKFARIKVIELSNDGRERQFEAKYTYVGADGAEKPFTPCDLRQPGFYLYKLNGALEPAKRNWKRATLVLSVEGKFDLNYEYDKEAQPPAPVKKPAAKDAKKK